MVLLFWQLNFPPYGSSLHFELYRFANNNEHYLQFVYRRPDVEYPEPIDIPGIGKTWTLKRFYSVYSQLIPGDFDTECKLEGKMDFFKSKISNTENEHFENILSVDKMSDR